MNVLYVINCLDMYGANKSLMDFIEKTDREKVKPIVLSYGYGAIYTECIRKNIEVYVIPFHLNIHKKGTINIRGEIGGLVKNIALLSKAKKMVEDNHITLIHSNASNVDFGAMLAMVCHLPHVWHIRELLQEDYNLYYDFPWLVHFLMQRADKIIAISNYMVRQRKLYSNHIVLYDGINIENYTIYKEQMFREEQMKILYVGVISKNKGVADVVKAVHYLVNRGYTNVKLKIAGGKSDYWYKIEQYICKNKLESYIEYYGYQAELRPLREWADIAIMSSRSEALGRVTIESMLGEVLVIGADRGATPELIQNGTTGYLYEPGNIQQLADKILEVYGNIEKSKGIIKKAKQFVIQCFDDRQYAHKLLEIYEDVIW